MKTLSRRNDPRKTIYTFQHYEFDWKAWSKCVRPTIIEEACGRPDGPNTSLPCIEWLGLGSALIQKRAHCHSRPFCNGFLLFSIEAHSDYLVALCFDGTPPLSKMSLLDFKVSLKMSKSEEKWFSFWVYEPLFYYIKWHVILRRDCF